MPSALCIIVTLELRVVEEITLYSTSKLRNIVVLLFVRRKLVVVTTFQPFLQKLRT